MMETPPTTPDSARRIPPIRKSIEVQSTPEVAFRRFTAELGRWWPLRTHSLGEEMASDAVIEGRVGGRVYERWADGTEHSWGRVTRWEPPARVVFTWHVGRDESEAQEVEVRFSPAGKGRTRVELEHRGWEALGDEALAKRDQYDGGWTGVLSLFAEGIG